MEREFKLSIGGELEVLRPPILSQREIYDLATASLVNGKTSGEVCAVPAIAANPQSADEFKVLCQLALVREDEERLRRPRQVLKRFESRVARLW